MMVQFREAPVCRGTSVFLLHLFLTQLGCAGQGPHRADLWHQPGVLHQLHPDTVHPQDEVSVPQDPHPENFRCQLSPVLVTNWL